MNSRIVLSGDAEPAKVETVAVNGVGFGGQNAVTIFRALEA